MTEKQQAKQPRPPEKDLEITRWPIPQEILIEIVAAYEELQTAQETLEMAQAAVQAKQAEIGRLQRAAWRLSKAPDDAQLVDIFVGFTPAGTPHEKIAAVSQACREHAARQERQQLAKQWSAEE